jgi:hypothetical protein
MICVFVPTSSRSPNAPNYPSKPNHINNPHYPLPMPIIISVDSGRGIILVDSSDLVGVADLSESIEAVQQIVQQQGLNKALIDASALKLLPSTMHLNWFASELSKHTKGVKQAVIVSKQSPEEVGTVKTFAQKLGVNIQVFFSKCDALTWLDQ